MGLQNVGEQLPRLWKCCAPCFQQLAIAKLSDELELPNNGGDFNMTTLRDTALDTLAAKLLEVAMGFTTR